MNIEKEIYKMGEFYRVSNSKLAKENYDQFVYLLILEQPLGEQSRLEKMWEWEKE